MDDFNTEEIRKIVVRNSDKILSQTRDCFHEGESFCRFHASLISYLGESAIGTMKAIFITKRALEKLNSEFWDYNKLKRALDSDCFAHNTDVRLDLNEALDFDVSEFPTVRKPNSNDDIRNFYIQLSEQYIIFILNPDGNIHYFIDGVSYGDGIFFSEKDRRAFHAKKPMKKIDEVFSAYRQHLQLQNTYCKFFMPRCSILGWDTLSKENRDGQKNFLKEHKHFLRNKPENCFRDDLMDFLSKNLRLNSISKENLLSNFDRLDINIEDDAGFGKYFIEVKWMGTSASQTGGMEGTKYGVSRINPEAFKQTIRYLKHLHNCDKGVNLGYLAVFDARKDIEPLKDEEKLREYDCIATDSGADLKKLESQLSKNDLIHYRKLRKIRDFRVENKHPC